MITPTEETRALLLANGVVRDETPQFGYAGYREKSGGWLVIDESSSFQDTDHLIEDCVACECYFTAGVIKKFAESKTKKKQ